MYGANVYERLQRRACFDLLGCEDFVRDLYSEVWRNNDLAFLVLETIDLVGDCKENEDNNIA